jgi:hypothetical protein
MRTLSGHLPTMFWHISNRFKIDGVTSSHLVNHYHNCLKINNLTSLNDAKFPLVNAFFHQNHVKKGVYTEGGIYNVKYSPTFA